MDYRNWGSLTDRQQEIFSDNLFLDSGCASNVENYVDGAVQGCGCADSEEELHHHSPALMNRVVRQMDQAPQLTLKVENANELDTQINNILERLLESEDSWNLF